MSVPTYKINNALKLFVSKVLKTYDLPWIQPEVPLSVKGLRKGTGCRYHLCPEWKKWFFYDSEGLYELWFPYFYPYPTEDGLNEVKKDIDFIKKVHKGLHEEILTFYGDMMRSSQRYLIMNGLEYN